MEFKYPGELEISKVEITSSLGNTLDITSLVSEITIVESVFNNTLSGSITIVDAAGLTDLAKIKGFERVSFSYSTPTDSKKTLIFFVYKRPFLRQENYAYIYELALISYEAIIDQTTSKSKCFSGKHSDIVKQVFKETFSSNGKSIEISESYSSGDVINPYWSPFQFINWLSNRAIPPTKSKAPTYLFFERTDGFVFRPLERMFEEPAVFTFVNRATQTSYTKNKIQDKLQTIVDFSVPESGSSLEMISNGAFGSRLIHKDLTQNQYSISTFDIDEEKDFISLNPIPVKPKSDAFGSSLTSPNFTKAISTTNESNDVFSQWVLQRKSFVERLQAYSLEILVYGNTSLHAGQCVDVFMPSDNSRQKRDDSLSGKYIITSIKHLIGVKGKHMMSLQLSKESYAK